MCIRSRTRNETSNPPNTTRKSIFHCTMAAQRVTPKHFLITGIPGVGKTTLMMKIHQYLVKQSIQCSGFITEEVRASGRRIGFDVLTMDGQRGQLARVSDSVEQMPGSRHREYRVGQYTVNLLSFEQTALPTLQARAKESAQPLYLIDEIGKMELFSQTFVQAVEKLMSQPGITIIATIPVPKGKPLTFVEELRNNSQSKVFEVTRQNRDSILDDILAEVNAALKSKSS